ncbi:MAG: MBL fold metallo-hydrolase [Clostridia bacterium]|nr:MBL fold metallo-hydrolase [Clostridia bacterium]
MKITALMENTASAPELICEHGLSLYIEACGKKILFDMGQSGAFAVNAKRLGVDLSAVDVAILSHGHYDHGGGVLRFFEENAYAPLYVSDLAFAQHYNGTEKYIGLDPAIENSGRLVRTGKEDVLLAPGLTIRKLDPAARKYPSFGQGLCVKHGEEFELDDFLHEQYLEIIEGEKHVLVSGCSHRGILNIVHAFSPDVLVGGLHFMKLDPEGEELSGMGKALKRTHTVYYTGHCTGLAQYARLREMLGGQLHYLAAGDSVYL